MTKEKITTIEALPAYLQTRLKGAIATGQFPAGGCTRVAAWHAIQKGYVNHVQIDMQAIADQVNAL